MLLCGVKRHLDRHRVQCLGNDMRDALNSVKPIRSTDGVLRRALDMVGFCGRQLCQRLFVHSCVLTPRLSVPIKAIDSVKEVSYVKKGRSNVGGVRMSLSCWLCGAENTKTLRRSLESKVSNPSIYRVETGCFVRQMQHAPHNFAEQIDKEIGEKLDAYTVRHRS